MREISPELQARLESGITTLCTCWRLERPDGLVLGFTDHDGDVLLDDLLCHAATGVTTAAQETGLGLGIDGGEIDGALDSAAITAEDIAAGRFDGAWIERWLVDWQAPHLRLCLLRGRLGEITRAGGAYRAEVLGLAALLNAPVGRVCQKRCDAVLGDARCSVDLSGPDRRVVVEVVDQGPWGIAIVSPRGFAAGDFSHGTCRWLSGTHAGDTVRIVGHLVQGSLHWLSLLSRSGAIGDQAEITVGCDGEVETCRQRFGNITNFRGFPFMPGEDWALTAAPAVGGFHDGSARR